MESDMKCQYEEDNQDTSSLDSVDVLEDDQSLWPFSCSRCKSLLLGEGELCFMCGRQNNFEVVPESQGDQNDGFTQSLAFWNLQDNRVYHEPNFDMDWRHTQGTDGPMIFDESHQDFNKLLVDFTNDGLAIDEVSERIWQPDTSQELFIHNSPPHGLKRPHSGEAMPHHSSYPPFRLLGGTFRIFDTQMDLNEIDVAPRKKRQFSKEEKTMIAAKRGHACENCKKKKRKCALAEFKIMIRDCLVDKELISFQSSLLDSVLLDYALGVVHEVIQALSSRVGAVPIELNHWKVMLEKISSDCWGTRTVFKDLMVVLVDTDSI